MRGLGFRVRDLDSYKPGSLLRALCVRVLNYVGARNWNPSLENYTLEFGIRKSQNKFDP